jgi:hypothetical protein
MPKKVLPPNQIYKNRPDEEAVKTIKKYSSIYHIRRLLLEDIDNIDEYFLLGTDHQNADIYTKDTNELVKEGDITKKYFCIKKTKIEHLKKLLNDNHNMYEMIKPNDETKLYFDLEAPIKDDEDDTLLRTFFITAIAHILNNDFDIFITDEDIVILNSSRKNKFSNHLIYQSIKFNNLVEQKMFILYINNRFTNPLNDTEKEMFNKLFFIEDDKQKGIMDLHPYGNYQLIRCINQTKIYKSFKLLPTKNIDVLDTLICHNINSKFLITKKMIENKAEQMKKPIKQIKKKETKKNDEEPKTDTQIQISIEHFNNFDFTLTEDNTLMSKKNMTYIDLKNLPLYKRYLYLIPNNTPSYQDFLNIGFGIRGAGGLKEDWIQWSLLSKKTDNDDNIINGFDKFKIDGRTFNINTLKRLAKKSHPEYFNTEEELFRVYFDLELDDIKVIEEHSEFVSQEKTQDENNILDDNKFIILYAYLGRGKTTAIKRMIKEKKYERYLFLSPRVSFSLFISQEFEIDNYTDALLDENDKDKINISKSKKLIISVESIQKINVDNNYQCIFLDESEAILAQFSSPTMKSKYLDCYNKLNQLIMNAEKVVCADAFLTNRTIRFIKSYKQPITLIKNNTAPIKRDALRLSYEDLEKQLINEITNNKKPYICSSTKKQLELIDAGRKFMPDKFNKSLMYFGGYKRDDKMFKDTLKNINTTWKDASFVGTTPTNTIGCSYSQKNDFDNVYMMCPFPTCSVRDMFQMMMRVRHIKENKMYFSLPENKRNMKKNRDDIYYLSLDNFENYNKDKIQLCIDEVNKFISEEKDDEKTYTLQIMNDTLKQFNETPKALREIIYFNLFEMYISNTHYEKMYYKFLDKCGYKYDKPIETKEKPITKKQDKKDKEELQNIKDDNLEKMIKEYNEILDIDCNDIEKYILKEKLMKASSDDKLIKEKYFYKKMIKKDLSIEEQAINFYNGFINAHTKQYLQRAYDEKHKSYINMIESDIYNSNNCKEMIKGHFLKLSIINKFVEVLKIKNTFDNETLIDRKNIELLIPYVEQNRKKISNIFDFDDTAKENVDEKYKYKAFLPYIERCITNWSGCYFKIEKKDSHTKKPISYKLSGNNFFNLIKDKKIENKKFDDFLNNLDFINDI